jgi:hypothetical protein
MWANPREHEPSWHSPGELEAWARREARSEAMVADVLERATATTPEAERGNQVLRRLQTTAAALLIAAILGGTAWVAWDQTRWDADRESGETTHGDHSWLPAAHELSRFGPFRP